VWAVRYAALKAGVQVCTGDVDTYKLLQGEFSKAQCKLLFPKAATKAYTDETRRLLDRFEQVAKLRGDEQREARQDLQQQFEALQRLQDQSCQPTDHKTGQRKGLRLDIQLTNRDGDSLILDPTVVHSTAASRRQAEVALSWARKLGVAAMRRKEAAAITVRTAEKHKTYGPLLATLASQQLRGVRGTVPTFLPLVATTHHELGEGFGQLEGFLLAAYQQRLEDEGERPDGLVATDLLASFLTEFRFDVHCAIAKGQAQMQLAAGTPTAVRRGGQSGEGLSLRQGRAQDQALEQAQDQALKQAQDQAQEQGQGLEHGQVAELNGSLDSMVPLCEAS